MNKPARASQSIINEAVITSFSPKNSNNQNPILSFKGLLESKSVSENSLESSQSK